MPDLDAAHEQRWPVLRGALLDQGVRGVFAFPIMVMSVCVGALDLFRSRPGPLDGVVPGRGAPGRRARHHAAARPHVIGRAGRSDEQDEQDEQASETTDRPESSLAEADRVEVYQATGMLISALGVDADEALVRLRAHAMATDQSASQVARAIVERRLMLRPGRSGPHGDGRGSRR